MSALDDAVRGAVAFLEERGDDLGSRWAGVMVGEGDAQAAAEAIVTRQRPDGSLGSLAETRRVLALLDDVGARTGPVQEQAIAWLAKQQAADGSWGEAEAAVFETGVLVGLLARSPSAPTRVLERAGDWLAARFSPDAIEGASWLPLAGYAAAFANLAHEASDGILQWCGRELTRGFRQRQLDAVRCGRVLLWCDAPALPGGALEAGEVQAALLAQQAADGGWPGPEEARALMAWDGLVGLLRLGATERSGP